MTSSPSSPTTGLPSRRMPATSTPRQRPGDLARVDRLQRAALDDAGADVGAAAADVEQHVRAELLVDPVEALRRAAASRPRRSGADAGQVESCAGSQPGLAAGHQERRARRPSGSARVSSASRHCCRRSGYSGLPSIITIDARSSSAEISEFHIIQAVVVNQSSRSPGPQIPAQAVVLEVLEQDPAVAVHDRLGQPGRAGREQDVERVVERHRLELQRRRARRAGRPRSIASGSASSAPRTARGRRARAWAARRGSSPTSARRSIVLVAVAVAGDGEQHLGLELAEPVDHAARRRTPARRRPRWRRGSPWRGSRRASRGCSAGRPTTRSPRPTPEPPQPGARPRDLLAQLAEGRARSGARVCEWASTATWSRVLVARRRSARRSSGATGEPLRAGHLVARAPARTAVRANPEEVPDRPPEALEVETDQRQSSS